MTTLTKKIGVAILGVLMASLAAAADTTVSCYPEQLRSVVPPINQDVVIVIDETTPKHGDSMRSLREQVIQVTGSGAKRISLLAFAGNSVGQSLRVLGRWQFEDYITDEAVIRDTVIGVMKRSQKCVKEARDKARGEITTSLDKTLASLPIQAERSEILYALNSALRELVRPNGSTLLLVLSDGIQHSQQRSFYAPGGVVPKKLSVESELAAALKATPQVIKPTASYLSVVWLGMLSLAAPTKPTDKAIYLDASLIQGYVDFWTGFLRKNGNADKVQIGVQTVFNPDLSLPLNTRTPQ